MKNLVSLALTLLFLANCSKDSEVLASFDGGSITRFELNKTLEFIQRGRNQNEPISVDIQAKVLESLAVQKLIAESVIASGKIKESEINAIKDLIIPITKTNQYFENYNKKVVKNTPVEFMLMEIMILRKPAVGELRDLATKHLTTLNSLGSQKSRSEYISENTEEKSRKAISGLTEPICTNCGPSQFQEILDIANSGKGSDYVLYLPPGLEEVAYIVRKKDTERVHPERLSLYFSGVFKDFQNKAKEYLEKKGIDSTKPENREISYYAEGDASEKGEQYSGFTLKQFERYAMDLERKRIESEADLKYEEPPSIASKETDLTKVFTPETVLVRFKDIPYKMSDLLALYDSLPEAIIPPATNENAKIQEALKFFSQSVVPSLIGKNSLSIQKIKENRDLKFQNDQNLNSVSINIWVKELSKNPIVITEQQMRDEYELGKLYAYSTPDPKNPEVRNPLPFTTVKDKIKTSLEERTKETMQKEAVEKLKAGFHLQLFTDKLENIEPKEK